MRGYQRRRSDQAKTLDDRWRQIMENMEAYADTKLTVNDEVYRSESRRQSAQPGTGAADAVLRHVIR